MMQRAAMKIIALFLVLAATGSWLLDCSNSDLLDETEQRYTISMDFRDGAVGPDDDYTLDLDDSATPCTGDAEPFSNTFAEIIVTLEPKVPGITLTSYRIEYIPLQSIDSAGDSFLPVDLPEPEDGGLNTPIPSTTGGSTTTFSITWLSFNVKSYYVSFREYYTGLSYPTDGFQLYSRYLMRCTLYYTDEYGEDGELTAERTAFLGPYNACP